MRHLHMKQKGLKLTRTTNPYTDLKDNRKTNLVFCATMDPNTTQEENFTLTYAEIFESCPIKAIHKFTSCTYMLVKLQGDNTCFHRISNGPKNLCIQSRFTYHGQ